MAIEVKDLAGLSQPVTKLVEVVSAGCGALWRPLAIRMEAAARGSEIKAIARAEAEATVEASNIRTAAATDRIESLLHDHPDLAARAKQRLLAREVEGLLNIESIADFASEALPETVSPDPVSPDWRRKFFLEAENICDIDLQFLWGKVLAGEVAAPGTFSLRTLDTLRQLSRAEAELFQRACALAMSDGWIALPTPSPASLSPFGITFDDLLSLKDAGLLLNAEQLVVEYLVEKSGSREHVPEPSKLRSLSNNGVSIRLAHTPQSLHKDLQIPAVVFTKAGKELQRLVEPHETSDYLHTLGHTFRQMGCVAKRGVVVPTGGSTSAIVFQEDL
ncbi:MAG: DUF2806 domain-containing protein [Acidobacteriaceae bacterium]